MTTARRAVLDSEERAIYDHLLEMGRMATKSIREAMTALQRHDHSQAESVINGDGRLNTLLQDIERECVRTLASQQPVASDLRRILTGMHLAQELERIADHGADVAKILVQIDAGPARELLEPILHMGAVCAEMLEQAMAAYAEADAPGARAVAARDAEVDAEEQGVVQALMARMAATPTSIPACTRLMWIAHNLERIGDRVTNIGERIVFMVHGETPDLKHYR